MSSPWKNDYIRVNWHNKYSSRFAVVFSPSPPERRRQCPPTRLITSGSAGWWWWACVPPPPPNPRAILRRQTIGLLRAEWEQSLFLSFLKVELLPERDGRDIPAAAAATFWESIARNCSSDSIYYRADGRAAMGFACFKKKKKTSRRLARQDPESFFPFPFPSVCVGETWNSDNIICRV
jgi:hypothetical protein